jgi:hypothetical protein
MKPYQLLLAALLVPGIAGAAEIGSLLKNDTLRNEPYSDAKSLATLNRGDKVEILAKKGAWLQIKTSKASGWVRLLSVKRGTTGKSNEAASVLAVASGRAGTGQVVATTGVRGLSAEELKGASFNEIEVKQLEANSISAQQAQQFASSGNLKARKLRYLPNPKSSQENK